MTMLSSIIKFGRRHLHTVVSTELIKPSFPTPSHLKTYNLSLFDQSMPSVFSPMVTFYPNTGVYDHSFHDQTLVLKNSLSRALTKYYPFAGRHSRIAPFYVDCNDHGAEFVEASVDRTLADFHQSSQHEDLDQLFPYGRTWIYTSGDHDLQSDTLIPLAVQVNHFECGGMAVAVSVSHKIADGSSMVNFLSDWAKLTRNWLKQQNYEVPIQPHFISFEKMNINYLGSVEAPKDCVTKSFMFPNTKINELKLKVAAMIARSGEPITNPTRVEVLTWLLYKCSLAAAIKNNSGSFKPTCIRVAANLRGKMIEPLPENSIGNFLMGMEVQTTNETELKPELIIGELRKQKTGIRNLKNIEAAFALLLNDSSSFDPEERKRIFEDAYISTSINEYTTYGIDFGWGSPIKATLPGNLRKNHFILMDTPNKEGIEVVVTLRKQDMDIIQRDPELLAFC